MNRKNSLSVPAPEAARRDRRDDGLPAVLCGRSAAAARQLRAVMEGAASGEPCLIIAEEGLETLAVARLLHGRRSAAPFTPIHCRMGRGSDLHERLFGKNGDNRGARDLEVVGHDGALATSAAGTIVLQHVQELPAPVQRRLARVLRDGEVYIGERRRPTELSVRLVACAHPAIHDDVAEGRFKHDLLRHFAVHQIQLVPLRERPEDVPDIVSILSREVAARAGVRPRIFTAAALTALAALPWPGNIDEMREVLARLHAESPGPARQEDVLRQVGFGRCGVPAAPFERLREARVRFERDYIAAVLARHEWRMAEAASTLGIERANLYRKVRQLGLSKTAGTGEP